jgi:hypothetical protein
MAALYVVMIDIDRKDIDQALQKLQNFCDAHHNQMVAFNRADRIAAARPDGHFIRLLFRPTAFAYWQLMRVLGSYGDIEEAIAAGRRAVDAISWDGWQLRLNSTLGDLYCQKAASHTSPEAEEQYRLALQGYLSRAESHARLVRASGGSWENVPSSHWAKEISELKTRIRSAGGQISEEPVELQHLKESMRQ